jgi:RES domain-containing protein
VVGRATIPGNVRIATGSADDLPSNWFVADPPPRLQQIGREWLERGETAVLKAPSAIVIEEWNYLLNPLLPDYKKLRLSAPKPFSFDHRLARSKKK